MGENEKAFLWVRFMQAALAGTDAMTSETKEIPADELAGVAANIADYAMKEFQTRFPRITSIREN